MQEDENKNNLEEKELQKIMTPVESSRSDVRIRTFNSDTANAIKTMNASVLSVALAEDKKRKEENKIEKVVKNKSLLYLFFTILFFVGGVLFVVSIAPSFKNQEVELPKVIKSPGYDILRADEHLAFLFPSVAPHALLETTMNGLESFIETEKESGIYEAVLVHPSGTIVPSGEVFKTLKKFGRAPFNKEYAFGIRKTTDDFGRFLIFSFVGGVVPATEMRDWESELLQDLGPMLNIKTDSKDVGLFTEPFSDIVVKNEIARGLVFEEKTIILYAVTTDGRVVVSSDEETFALALQRIRENLN